MVTQKLKALYARGLDLMSGDNLGPLLARRVSGTFLLTGVNLTLNFATSLTLARLLGAHGFGAYSYAIALITLLMVPALLGFENVVIRNVSVLSASGDLSLMKGLLKRSVQIVSLASAVFVFLVLGCVWIFGEHQEEDLSESLKIGVFLLPILTITRLIQSAMQGLHKVVPGQMPERLFLPALFFVSIVSLWLAAPRFLSAEMALVLHISCAVVALGAGGCMLFLALPVEIHRTPARYATRDWLASALPLLAVMSAHIVIHQTDIVMLGMMAEAREVGIYRAATKGAELISFSLFIVSPVVGPVLARLHHEGDVARLQGVVTMAATASAVMALPLSLILIFAGKYLLLLFGPEFVDGATALSLLSVAHFANAFAGVAGVVLVMSGHEKDAALGFTTGAITNVLLNLLLIPRFGMEGAAIATGISLFLLNAILVLRARLTLSIKSTALRFV